LKKDYYTGEKRCKCGKWFKSSYSSCKECREETEMKIEEELFKKLIRRNKNV
jgi:hypothetical protein